MCWGNDTNGAATPPAGTYVEVAAGQDVTCALTSDGTPTCWGRLDVNDRPVPDGRFVALDARDRALCGIRTDGRILCWITTNDPVPATETGVFSQVRSTLNGACALSGDRLRCWGGGWAR